MSAILAESGKVNLRSIAVNDFAISERLLTEQVHASA